MLRIVTLNAANYDDIHCWDERKPALVDAFVGCKADIIALQEIRFDAGEESTKTSYLNMGEQLALELQKRTGYGTSSVVYQWAQYYDPVTHNVTQKLTTLWEGLAIISRKPFIETGTTFLSMPANSGDLNHRITQYAAFYPDGGGVLYLFNTHFAVYEWCNQCVVLNATETLKYMNQFSSSPRLLVGDLNIKPEDKEVYDLLTGGGLIDVWPLKHSSEEKGYTYPSGSPNERIDYVWADKSLVGKIDSIELLPMQEIKDCPYPQTYASDHLGLVVTLSV